MFNFKYLFLITTASISYILFKYQKFVEIIIRFISNNMYDNSIIPFGMYMCNNPIVILSASNKDKFYTNKLKLICYNLWDFDINGLDINHIKLLNVDNILIFYKYKGSNEIKELNINLIDSTIKVNNEYKPVLFNEINFIE